MHINNCGKENKLFIVFINNILSFIFLFQYFFFASFVTFFLRDSVILLLLLKY